MRVVTALGLLLAGAVTGLASVALHHRWWGLLLAVVTTITVLLVLRPRGWDRLAFGLGWAGLVGWLVVPRPEGDFAVGTDPAGLSLLGLWFVVVVLTLSTGPLRRRRRRG